MFHCAFHCAFHCVSLRSLRFTTFHCVSQRRARFTASHSVARISLSVCCELGWRGSNNVRKAYRGVECMPPAPPCGNVGQVPCFCDTEAFLAYSKPDHVSNVSHLLSWAICIAACDCCFGWIRFCYGPGEEKVRMIAMFWIMCKALRGFSKLVYALRPASLFDEKLYRLYFVIAVTVAVRL